jgi:hypothetical protein
VTRQLTDIHFTINIDGENRSLFRVEQRKEPPELLIKVRHPQIARLVRPLEVARRPEPTPNEKEEFSIKEAHYSIHPSVQSADLWS